MAKTVVGLFDSRTNIEDVIRDLDRIGVPKRHIHTLGRAEASEKGERSWTERVASFFGFTGQERERELGAAYADAMKEGDTLLIVDVDDPMADPTAVVLNQHGAIDMDARTAGRAGREELEIPAPPESRTVPISVQTTVPVVEEELEVGKRTVERGGVRVHSHVEEMPIEEVVRLREEHVNIERRPVDRPVSGTDPFQEVTVEVKETAEEPVVVKQARVVEEVVIDKQTEVREETIEDTIRRQEVEVEQLPKTGTGGRR
jgi:stress response protein YsnF